MFINSLKRSVPCKLLVIAALAALICLNRLVQAAAFVTDIPTLLLVSFGGVLPFEGLSFYESLIAAAPIVAQFVLFGEFISADMPTVSVYIFSRTRKRDVWLFGQLIRLSLLSLLCFCVCIATGVGVGLFAGLRVSSFRILTLSIALLIVTLGAWGMLMICIVAALCIKFKAHTVISAGAVVFIVWVFTMNFIPAPASQYILPLTPMSNALLAAHSGVSQIEFLTARLGEISYIFPLWWSAVYFVVWAAMFVFIVRRRITVIDFM